MVTEDRSPRLEYLIVIPVTAAWCLLLATTEAVARRLSKPKHRVGLVLLVGSLACLAMLCAGAWVNGFARGGPSKAWLALTSLPAKVWADPADWAALTLTALTPFALLGAVRLGAFQDPPGLPLQGCAGATGGLLAVLVIVFVGGKRWDGEATVIFIAWGACTALGMALGEHLEHRLTAWWTRRQEAQDRFG